MQVFEGDQDGKGLRFALVVSRFHEEITGRVLDKTVETLGACGVKEKNVTVAWVPGAFELPLLAKRFAETGEYDGVICIGLVIRGETSHFDYVCSEAASGILRASLETNVPIIFSVMTTENREQAEARIERVGEGYARAAIEMANVVSCV